MKERKITFKDLSTNLQVLVIYGTLNMIIWTIWFIIGIIIGILEVI